MEESQRYRRGDDCSVEARVQGRSKDHRIYRRQQDRIVQAGKRGSARCGKACGETCAGCRTRGRSSSSASSAAQARSCARSSGSRAGGSRGRGGRHGVYRVDTARGQRLHGRKTHRQDEHHQAQRCRRLAQHEICQGNSGSHQGHVIQGRRQPVAAGEPEISIIRRIARRRESEVQSRKSWRGFPAFFWIRPGAPWKPSRRLIFPGELYIFWSL